jgi:hypothetical protein
MIADIMLAHDIPLRFEGPLVQYAETGVLTGVELKCRVKTLSEYQACIERINKDYHIGRELDGNRFTDASHPDFPEDSGRGESVVGGGAA